MKVSIKLSVTAWLIIVIALWPTKALAAPPQLELQIYPLECTSETVHDGFRWLEYIYPETCRQPAELKGPMPIQHSQSPASGIQLSTNNSAIGGAVLSLGSLPRAQEPSAASPSLVQTVASGQQSPLLVLPNNASDSRPMTLRWTAIATVPLLMFVLFRSAKVWRVRIGRNRGGL